MCSGQKEAISSGDAAWRRLRRGSTVLVVHTRVVSCPFMAFGSSALDLTGSISGSLSPSCSVVVLRLELLCVDELGAGISDNKPAVSGIPLGAELLPP
jgi:hypothetical protein